jgi:hypothetical protein
LLLAEFAASVDAQIDGIVVGADDLGGARSGVVVRRSRWLLVPVAAVAAVAAGVVLLVGGPGPQRHPSTAPPAAVQPRVVAVAESKSLLAHADLLLTAAHVASSSSARVVYVREARADLDHVATLLPLTPPASRPGLRQQFVSLHRALAHGGPAAPGRPSPRAGERPKFGGGVPDSARGSLGSRPGSGAQPSRINRFRASNG